MYHISQDHRMFIALVSCEDQVSQKEKKSTIHKKNNLFSTMTVHFTAKPDFLKKQKQNSSFSSLSCRLKSPVYLKKSNSNHIIWRYKKL